MPEGAFRRPPQLWEQKLSAMVGANSVGTVAGSSTSEVGSDLTPGDGGPPPEAAVIPPSPTAFSMPSTPTLSGGVQSLMVTWDGNNSNGDPYPYETAVVEIHISTTSGFSPSSATLRGELAYAGSHTITGLSAGVTYYVVLRGRDGQGNFSAVSTQASGQTGLTTSSDYGNASILPGSVSFDARAIGGIATTVGSTAPTSPISGDIWLDTTGGATVHKRWSGSAWITQAWGSDSLSANCITAVQVAAGAITAGAIAADAVTAASIAADAIDGKVITGATIRTSATAGTSTAPRAGLVIDTAGLRGFDSSGSQTININASTGAVTINGNASTDLVTASSLGSGGSTTIDGGRITTGTISASRIDVANLTVEKLTSGPYSSRRVVIGAVGSTDSVQFLGASTSNGWLLNHAAIGTDLSLTSHYSNAVFKVSPSITCETDVTANRFISEANAIQYNGYRTTTAAGDVILRLRSNVTTTAEAKFEVDADGDVKSRTNSYAGFSDARYKENVTPARDYLDDLRQVNIVTFNWQGSDQKLLGVTAQQLQNVFPSMVAEDDDGTLSVRYSVFVPMLITAVQSLADKVDKLTARIEALEGA